MSQKYNYTDSLNLVVAFLMRTKGTFGVVCNSLIVYIFLKEKSERTAFNVICFFRAISNVIILTTIFLFTYLPKTLLAYSQYPPVIESWLIKTSNPLYFGNEHQLVLIAINRFCAMFFLIKYSRIFSLFHTKIILVLIYLSRIAQEIYEWLPWSAKGCHMLFSAKYFALELHGVPSCDWVYNASEVIKYAFIATAILNFITFLKILHFYKKSKSSQAVVEAKKIMRKNIFNCIQTILLDSLYLIDTTVNLQLSSWSTSRVWKYFCGTFIWECLHSLDGIMSQEYNYTDPLNLMVAFLLGTIGTFGVACNTLIFYIFLKEKSEKTAFNVICFFRAISNFIILTNVFLINFLPKTLLGFSPYPPVIESWLINTANTLYLGNEYQIVLIAINRFCAMFFPTNYSRIFSLSNTTIILVLIYLYRIAIKVYELLPESEKGCHALFSTKDLAWKYSSAPGCDWVDNAPEVIMYTFITIAILNFITFLKILHFYKKPRCSQEAVEAKKRMRKNIIYFIQTILQDSLYLIDMTLTFELSSWSTRRVWTYFCGTFIWECLHSLDGFIMIIFNEKLTFIKSKMKNILVLPIIGGGHPPQGRTSVTTYSYGNNL